MYVLWKWQIVKKKHCLIIDLGSFIGKVFLIKGTSCIILSVSAATKTGFKFLFDDKSVFLFNCDWKLQIQGTKFVDNLYYLNINVLNIKNEISSQVTDDIYIPWIPLLW